MNKERFDDYIRRFNNEDATTFDDYLAPNVHVKNGTLEYDGIQGMKDHYAPIWVDFTEHLIVPRFVSSDDTLAIQMRTIFTARHDNDASLFGPVKKDETFEFNGVIMYRLENDRFADILVAYNSFVHTDNAGVQRDLGIPH